MKKEYLKPLCERRATVIFEHALRAFNFPRTEERIEEMREHCEKQICSYNRQEQEIMRETLDRLFRDYKSEIQFYVMVYH